MKKVNDQNGVIAGSLQNPGKVLDSVVMLLLHIVLLVTASVVVFKKKDVLS
jgi:ABC-2 type transport system permease protein